MTVAMGKFMGFSLWELGELTLQDLLDISEAYGSILRGGDKNGKQYASQSDIDRFNGWRA